MLGVSLMVEQRVLIPLAQVRFLYPLPYKNTSHDYAVKLGEGSNTGESVCFYMVDGRC